MFQVAHENCASIGEVQAVFDSSAHLSGTFYDNVRVVYPKGSHGTIYVTGNRISHIN